MKIAVNLLPFRETLGGVGRYAKNTLQELAKIDTQNEYMLFLSNSAKEHFQFDNKKFNLNFCEIDSNNFFNRIFFEQFRLPKLLQQNNIDLLFTPSVAIPYFSSVKKITTVHDIAYKRLKKKYPWLRRNYIAVVTSAAMKKSDIILTVSEFSKKELKHEFGEKTNPIKVIYNGVGFEYFQEYNETTKKEIVNRYELPNRFILYVGAIEPGKNLDILLESFQKVCEQDKTINLVMTGGLGWKKDYIYTNVNDQKVRERIKILPYIPDEELPLLYRMAGLFVYVSPYEGFGIPVLEAMASKVPVLASKSEAIQEFAKDSIFYVNEDNVNFMSKTISGLLTKETEVEVKVENAFSIAKELTWETSAKKLYEIIKGI